MRVAELLAHRLYRVGVRQAFGIPGGEILALIDALDRTDIEYVTARHETAAGLMAEGAWHGTGAPGLLVVTLGPGVSNAVNAVANASLDRVPLVVVTGAPALGGPVYTHQVFDQRALLKPVVKASFVATAETVEADLERALALALAHPRGPVQIELPQDVATHPVVQRAPEISDARETSAGADPDQLLRTAADWLADAERPLILAGLEASTPATSAALAALVDRTQARVFTTYKAKGVIDERDPRCLGAIALSPHADAIALPVIQRADVVLLVGYDPVEMRAAYAQPFAPDARVVELAAAPRAHGMHGASLEWVGEIERGLSQLTAACRSHPQRARWPAGEPDRARAELRAAFSVATSPGFSPLAVAHVLSRAIPEGVRVTVDTGAHRIALSQVFESRQPNRLLQSNGLCTMGYALPCAIGLSHASGERVVAVMGDGGLEMVAGELATLRDLGSPVTLVVFDDRSLALIEMKQRAQRYRECGVALGATDHVGLARALGGEGVRVGSVQALEDALAQALTRTAGFTLISCALPPRAYDGWL